MSLEEFNIKMNQLNTNAQLSIDLPTTHPTKQQFLKLRKELEHLDINEYQDLYIKWCNMDNRAKSA
jgi:hypothetical protein